MGDFLKTILAIVIAASIIKRMQQSRDDSFTHGIEIGHSAASRDVLPVSDASGSLLGMSNAVIAVLR